MGAYDLTLFRHASGVAFDPHKVIAQVRIWFPEAQFLPGDQLAAEVERAEGYLANDLRNDPDGPAKTILRSLRRKSHSYGPSFAFRIPLANGSTIRGHARSSAVGFLFEEPLPEEMRQRLLAFLHSLGIGKLETSKEGYRSPVVLADLNGLSDCLRDDGRVPWMEPMPGETITSEAK